MFLAIDVGRIVCPGPLGSAAHLSQTRAPDVSYRKKVAVAEAWDVPGKYKDKRLVQGQALVAGAGSLELALDKQDAGKRGGSEAENAAGSKAGNRDGYTAPSQEQLRGRLERPEEPVPRRMQMEEQCSRTEHSRRRTAVHTAARESWLAAADTAGSMQRSQAQRWLRVRHQAVVVADNRG